MNRPILLLSPALTVIILLFLGGLFLGWVQSLGYFPLIGRTQLSLDAYRQLSQQPAFWQALWLTLWIALASTLLSTLFALLCALYIHSAGRHRRWLTLLIQINLPIPHLVAAISFLLLLGQSGLVARGAFALGWIEESADFPILIEDRLGFGIIAQYVWKTTCFTAITLLATLRALGGPRYEEVAATLGANRRQRVLHITLPLLRPALSSSAILVFAFTFGAFETPYILGQRYPSALPVLAYRAYTDVNLHNRPIAMALNIIIALISALLILLYWKTTQNDDRSTHLTTPR